MISRRLGANMSAMFIAVIFLVGCTATSRTDVITLRVSDSDDRPIEGALVSISPMKFFMPTWPHPTIDRRKAPTYESATDERGIARLEAFERSPARLVVDADGFARHVTVVEYRGLSADGTPRWSIDPLPTPSPAAPGARRPTLTVRLVQ